MSCESWIFEVADSMAQEVHKTHVHGHFLLSFSKIAGLPAVLQLRHACALMTASGR